MTLAEVLAADDRKALQIEIDRELAKQDPRAPAKARMEALRLWIEQQDSVERAEINPILIDSDPPVQQIWIMLASDPDEVRTVGIVLDGKKLRFNTP